MSRLPVSISAVLPAYNEVAVIADVVQRTHAALGASGVARHEVIVVDDGSNDGTAERVLGLATELPATRLLRHTSNLGYGAALRTGFDAARGEAVWLLDSDGQFDPADLALLLPCWEPGSMVAGYRAQRQDPWARRASHAAFFTLVRLLNGPTLRDVNCAFKLFARELGVGLQSQGAMISTELALRARDRGCRTVEVAVPHHPRTTGEATGARPAVVARAFVELLGLRADRDANGSGNEQAEGALRRRR
ncbi:MAG: putative dolichol-phosphate mannosyltransferase-putative rane bound sugar transferase involved in [Chloroflexi bacterium]|jgi:glycosyltransferase involved in cell wall biosynthesis|nr:putative dolichol-phosphate mannosyltransferase-putative rane bound sugar transferase involved in [Chloroflexota bacterium]